MVGLTIIGIVFVILWIGIIYEIKNMPTIDRFGNIIKDRKSKRTLKVKVIRFLQNKFVQDTIPWLILIISVLIFYKTSN